MDNTHERSSTDKASMPVNCSSPRPPFNADDRKDTRVSRNDTKASEIMVKIVQRTRIECEVMAPNHDRPSVDAAIRRNRIRKDLVMDSLSSVPFNKKENVVLTMKMKGKILIRSPFRMPVDKVGRHFSFNHRK